MSEKYDGSRAFWDGGISRGLECSAVPWANTAKDSRLKIVPIATGLWSRYGNKIDAPEWFLDSLPKNLALDGEIYAGRGRFQFCRSAAGKHQAVDSEWEQLRFMVLDAPAPAVVLGNGEINETNFKKSFRGCYDWWKAKGTSVIPTERHISFQSTYTWLEHKLEQNDFCVLAHQEQLPFNTVQAVARMNERMEDIVTSGGEGVIIRKPSSMWLPNRVHECLKVKPCEDAEATVVGYVWGRETALGSKLLGLMGALIVEYSGKRFELSGFTDAERVMSLPDGSDAKDIGAANPGKIVDPGIANPTFPIGSTVTFKYREFTDAGIPKEARYFRK